MRPGEVLVFLLFVVGVFSKVVDHDVYAQAPTTVLGCTCTSECTTGLLFLCDVQPYCSVADRMGDCALGVADWSVSAGYYDYCIYEEYLPYEAQSAKAKQQLLLKKIAADSTPGTYPGAVSILTGMMGESMKVSFETQSDVFPEPRTKYIHTVGTVAPIRWESSGDHGYAGLFQGAEYGLIRLSAAAEPGSSGFAPGAAVKLFRDGRPSSNFQAMPGLNRQPCEDTNFFKNDFTTHIAGADDIVTKIGTKKFWQASYCQLMVGVSDFADGKPDFPFMLTLRPASGLNVDCPCMDYAQCLRNIGGLASGSALFDVLATAAPGDSPQPIGRIVLTGSFSSGSFGNEQLFFKHTAMERSFGFHPEWLEKFDHEKDCGMKSIDTKPPGIEEGCSSPWNSTARFRKKDMRADDVVV